MDRAISGIRVLGVVGLGLLLTAVSWTLGGLALQDVARLSTLQADDLVVMGAELAGAAVAGWLALGVLVTVVAHLAGVRLQVNLLPAALRPLISAALGATVVVGAAALPASAAPLTGTSTTGTTSTTAAPASSELDPGWVPSASGPSHTQGSPSASKPHLSTPSPTSPAPRSVSTPTPSEPKAPSNRSQHLPGTQQQSGTGRQTPAVEVHRGDTLWGIAERHLRAVGVADPSDQQVAAQWPRWYAANHAAIGEDPDELTPGTVLRAPR